MPSTRGCANYVAVGGSLDLAAGLDNFCWCDPVLSEKNPDGAYKMAQLVRSNQALYDVCLAYNLPLISGKDSMKNDFYDGTVKISIPPTLLFSVIGRIEDIRRAVTMDVKRPGDIVYLLGKTGDELGGSEYFALSGAIGTRCRWLTRPGPTALSGIPPGCSGRAGRLLPRPLRWRLAVAAAESAFAGGYGMAIDLDRVLWKGDAAGKAEAVLLFSESASRHLVTIHPEKRDEFEGS